ncbi:ABC transporter permease [Roseobacter denitrificans]|uniref:Oligopeptide ABC transporter, permease protein n=1 Tax=Roseobacter denitrificans (strain ATCC 33942 / OCh 114) TaxID=375451 RepID=Q168X0_ROSDO|nr:ABC transporter permease [Roseobacter denitrificans]ABG31473.1 oligopeptide ABC transporter, permease protein [Roseobacter denitrificans OCh 114]AVL54480.1 ABC transporter permease [Roseobacter denitrificans]SFF90963.1 peptide/nickel transport system permease protein [Roseobacter denitrificans OCh 114]
MIAVLSGLILRAVVVLTGTAVATFALLWHAPGDPALAIALARFGSQVPAEVVDEIRREAGLETGFWPAFQAWISPLLRGDFGQSSVTGRDVWPDLVTAMSYSFPLAILGLLVGLVISVPLAVIATRRPGGLLDRLAVALASMGTAIPQFWLALLLILLFAVHLGWLPAMGARTPTHAILPALALGLGVAASFTRILRSGILEARSQPFLPAIRRRGVAARRVERDHVAPHAAVPVITVFGLELAFLLEGIVVIEVIFARPGLGSFLVNAIFARDFPKVQAVVIVTAVIFVIINLVIDLLYRALDPRIGERNA